MNYGRNRRAAVHLDPFKEVLQVNSGPKVDLSMLSARIEELRSVDRNDGESLFPSILYEACSDEASCTGD
jgi:hypothetical protein